MSLTPDHNHRRRKTPIYPRPSQSRPAFPFYGLYSRNRVPVWLLKTQQRKTKPKSKLGLILVFSSLVVTMLLFVGIALGLLAGGVTGASAGYAYFSRGLSLDKSYELSFEVSRIYDRNNVLLYEKFPSSGAREYVTYGKVPQIIIDATLSAEDPTFFDNSGYDMWGILRAVYINASGSGSSGASGITQQVARHLYLPPEERFQQTIERKIRELILATMITEKFTKQEVLEKYLNQIYYGNLAYGIQAASMGYFGKEPKDLNIAEAAMLAGLPQLPSVYDPTVNYELARRRQSRVLELMVKNEKITQEQADQAFAYDIKANLKDNRKRNYFIRAPHFVNYIMGELGSEKGYKQLTDAGINITAEEWEQGGFEIVTTADIRLVEEAELVARKRIEDLSRQNANNAAMVAIRPGTGEILSMIGSIDYNSKEIDGQFNTAVARRQPGSSIKPITYVAALEKGWTAATVIGDIKTTFRNGTQGYSPNNFDGQVRGPVSLRNALGSSLNIPAVKALQYTTVPGMMDLGKKMGITFERDANFYGLPLTLGGGEVKLLDLTGAYAVFDNLGQKAEPVGILKMTKRGKTVYEFDPNNVKRTQVVSPQSAYIITHIMSDNNARLMAFAANNPLVLDRPAAAKTGTTEDFKDSWTVGYTPDLVVGVWVGRNDNKPMRSVAGSIGGGQIWNDYMKRVYSDPTLSKAIQQGEKPLQRDFVRPADIVEVEICDESGLLPNEACPKRRVELFAKGSVPKEVSQMHTFVNVPKFANVSSDPYFKPTNAPSAKTDDFDAATYCIAGKDYPADMVQRRLFYYYPPDLQAWGASRGRVPPPTQPCPPYIPPTPTAAPTPTQAPVTILPVEGLTPAPTSSSGGGNAVPPTPTPTPNRPAPTPTPQNQLVTVPPTRNP
jgi:membrane peptidoglycan carboxypeptidase